MKALSWIQLSQEIQQIFQLYFRLHGVRLSLFTPEGKKIYPSEDQPDCSYCRLVRKELGFEEKCLKLDRRMISLAVEENRMIRYHCHGAMEEAALPLNIEGEIAGCIMLGQFRKLGMDSSPYGEVWMNRFSDNRLDLAYKQTVSYSEDKIPLLMEVYQVLLNLLSRERLIRHRDFDMILPVIKKLEENPAWNPTLEEAAELIGRSSSALTRLFRTITGNAFKSYLVEWKISRAEQIMSEHPRKPLKEIAWQLGYSDPLYFSRLFKRYRGVSPRSIRKKYSTELESFFQPGT